MDLRLIRRAVFVAAFGLAGAAASAQSLDSLKSKAGDLLGQSSSGSSSSGTSLLSGLGSGSISPGTAQNAAGVLGYCQKQGYIKSGSEQIKDKLLGKLGGEQTASQDSGYQQGLSGVLQGGDGQSFNLSSLKGKIGEKVCKKFADKAASSFLGG